MGRGRRDTWGPAGLRRRQPFVGCEADTELKERLRLIGERIRPCLGVSIEGWGRLEKSDAGFPAGTPFVLIAADCLDEKRAARNLLYDIAGLTDLAWDYGWESAPGNGQVELRIRVFPQAAG